MESGYVLCWSAKFFGENEKMHYSGLNSTSKKVMLNRIWKLLDKTDVVVHYNGKRFDIPTLNGEFAEVGMTPPSPYKQIDLLRVVKSQFRFPSNKLAYVAPRLGCQSKVSHTGHQLWIDCMAGNKEAWEMMETYNKQDVVLLEELYAKCLPWIPGHPNPAIYDETEELLCRCGSDNYVKEGFAKTLVGKYQQYSCKDCGSWFRDGKNLNAGKQVGRNIVG